MFLPKTHIRLDVFDADESAAFYQALLGAGPARRGVHSAVFELDSPPLLLTLEKPASLARSGAPGARPSAGAASRAAFALVVTEPEHVGDAAVALRRAGVRLRLEDQGIETHDPDGNRWRVRFVPFARGRAVFAI